MSLNKAVAEPPSSSSVAMPPRLARVAEQLNANDDFPAVSTQIFRVMSLADHERESLRSLTQEILKDVALTNKLLRVVNAARFAGHQDGVGTVSRAISLLGVAAVRQLALSLVLLEHLENKHQVQWLRQTYLKTLLTAHVAVELASGQAEPEAAFLTAMFQSLGPVVALCHFPAVTQALAGDVTPNYDALQQATQRALGVSLDELGGLIANMWSLPDTVRRAMERPQGKPPVRSPHDGSERLRWIARAAAEISDIWCRTDSVDPAAVERTVRSYLPVLGQSYESAMGRLAQARLDWAQAATALGLDAELQRLEPKAASSAQAAATLSSSVPLEGISPEQVLAQGLDDITAAMVDGADAQDRARMGLEAICRALGLTRAVLCRLQPGANGLKGWIGLGQGGEDLCKRMTLRPGATDDTLSTLSGTGRDTWVPDVRQASWISRLPAWLAPPKGGGLLLMPLHQGTRVVGVIYADGTDGRHMSAEIPGRTLLLSLRRLLVMAVMEPPR